MPRRLEAETDRPIARWARAVFGLVLLLGATAAARPSAAQARAGRLIVPDPLRFGLLRELIDRLMEPRALAARWPAYAELLAAPPSRPKDLLGALRALHTSAPDRRARAALQAWTAELRISLDPEAAAREIDALPAAHPSRGDLAYRLGMTWLRRGRPREAARWLEAVPFTSFRHAAADLALARIDLPKNPAGSRDRLLRLPERWLNARGRATRLDLLGRALDRLGQRTASRVLLGRLWWSYPKYPGLAKLKRLLRGRGIPGPLERVERLLRTTRGRKLRRALARLARRWRRSRDGTAAVAYAYGRVYAYGRDRERAMGRYRRAIRRARDRGIQVAALGRLARAAYQLGERKTLLGALDRAERLLVPGCSAARCPPAALYLDPLLWDLRTIAWVHAGETARARAFVATLDPWIGGQPVRPDLLFRLGATAWVAGDLAEADRRFHTLARDHGDQPGRDGRPWGIRARVWLAALADARGETGAAMLHREALRRRWPLSDEAREAGRPATVSRALDWRDMAPPLPEAGPWTREARYYVWAGRRPAAEKALRQAVLRGHATPRVVAALIHVRLAMGRGRAARRAVRRYGAALGATGTGPNALLPLGYPLRFEAELRVAARQAGIPADLLAAVVRHESGFNPTARSHRGARGLTQLVPRTARAVAARRAPQIKRPGRKLHDPGVNLELGAHVLAELIERYRGDLVRALVAYNAGAGRLHSAWKPVADAPPALRLDLLSLRPSVAYARKVLAARGVYRMLLRRGDAGAPTLLGTAEKRP